jgi:CarD family transcriptional regulator
MEILAAQPETGERRPPFDVGDLVVHPHLGAGRVVSRRRRRLAGGERNYLEIDLTDSALKIMVPCESAAAIGLRAVVGPRRLRRIVAVLEGEPDAVLGNWSARERRCRDRLKGGDVLELASVVRDLTFRATDMGLSAREDDLYQRLRRLLASELACALGIDAEHAVEYIDEHVASRRCAEAHAPRAIAE